MINDRRGFLKGAGAGLAAGSLASMPQSAIAQNAFDQQRPAIFPVTNFGAKGDGGTLDTPAINSAIEAASRAGGGIILFPAGSYLSYSLHLRSNVTLHLSTGSTIVAAPGPQPGEQGKYDLAESNIPWENYQDFGHNHWHNSLIWGEGIENVAITGSGMIWGKGLSRGWDVEPRAEHPGAGNKAIALKNCRNVLFRDFAIFHGGHFGILATGVDNLTIDNLTIDTNRDGMDIDCCRNVHVSNCTVNSPWDDGICLKSSYALGYARATEMVTITNCTLTGDFEEGTVIDATFKRFGADAKVPRTGRIKFGTESNGGFKNVAIANCVFDGCRGLAIETVDGGVIEDVSVINLSMRDIREAPIFVRLGARMRGPEGVPVGVVRRVNISNVVCTSAPGQKISSILAGIPGHPLEDVRITGVTVLHHGGGSPSDAALRPPENENKYPEPNMFGTTPSQGFFIRHVDGLEMASVKIESAADDARPSFVLDDVRGADFRFLKLPIADNNTFVLNNVHDFSLFRSKPVPDTELAAADKRL
jgi:polygalacturonase